MKSKAGTDTEFFRTEKIPKILLQIAPPVMLAQLIQAMYNIVDSFFVGKYSEPALTDRCLSAKGHNCADRLLDPDNIQHILRCQRLKIQTVCYVEVGGNGLRVVSAERKFARSSG